jgi:hypothetical protein
VQIEPAQHLFESGETQPIAFDGGDVPDAREEATVFDVIGKDENPAPTCRILPFVLTSPANL